MNLISTSSLGRPLIGHAFFGGKTWLGRNWPGGVGMLCILLLLFSGCATLITSAFPPEHSVRYGEKRIGKVAAFRYRLEQDGRTSFVLERAPLCPEVQEKLAVSKKRMRGVLLAIAETPFFGLGLADLLLADITAKNSETTKAVGTVPTGKLLPCGVFSAFAQAKLMIQIPELDLNLFRFTDAKGRVDLGDLVQKFRFHSLNIFVVENEDFHYLTTLYAR